jgi:hypothetical protein
MADNQREPMTETPEHGNDPDKAEGEKAPDGRGQDPGNEGDRAKRNRGENQAIQGQRGPTDPDSAESDIDRDDTVTD